MNSLLKKDNYNWDYLKQIVEIPLLFRLSLKRKKYIRNPRKILIVNTCLIGDISASLSAIRQFIKKRKSAKIDVIVPPPMKCVMEKVKGVNYVYTAKSVSNRKSDDIKLLDKELKELRSNKYDLILIVRLSKDAYNLLKKVKFKSIKISPFLYTQYILHLLKKIIYRGKVKQYRDVNFEWVGEDIKELSFNEIFDIPKKDYERIKRMPEMRGKEKKILIHAGTSWKKDWKNEKWAELVKKINSLGKFKFIFVGGDKKEEQDFDIIRKKLNFKVFSVIRKVNLLELLLMMKLSNYFMGIDSGPRNLAHLADLRSVSLVGPGPKHFMPINNKDIVVDKSSCHCTQLFCFRDQICIKSISVKDVFNAFKKLLKNNR